MEKATQSAARRICPLKYGIRLRCICTAIALIPGGWSDVTTVFSGSQLLYAIRGIRLPPVHDEVTEFAGLALRLSVFRDYALLPSPP
jgi:hypothetical protein